MQRVVPQMTRPVTDSERAALLAAQAELDTARARAQDEIRAAERKRDLVVLRIYNSRASVTEIARALGTTRQTIHRLIKELAEAASGHE